MGVTPNSGVISELFAYNSHTTSYGLLINTSKHIVYLTFGREFLVCVSVMDSPVIECLVSGRQRISLNRASLRRKRSMRAATKTAAAAVHAEKSKPRAQKAKSTVLQECVKTYFASLNSISRSIVLESEALQQLCPDWEKLNAKQQEEILNKHFVPSSVAEHYSNGDRRSMSPFSDAEPEIDVTPRSNRYSAKKESIAKAKDEACFSPKGKVRNRFRQAVTYARIHSCNRYS